jgi:hypothetical protein
MIAQDYLLRLVGGSVAAVAPVWGMHAPRIATDELGLWTAGMGLFCA